MLTPERAQAALKEFAVDAEDGKQQIKLAAAKLGIDLQRIALGLREIWLDGEQPARNEQFTVFQRAFDQLVLLPEDQRRQVVAAVFPSLADSVEAAWQLAERVPYKSFEHYRQAFRAPSHSELAIGVRQRLLLPLARITPRYHHQDIAWFAQYAGYLGSSGDQFGLLFAAVIDQGGETGERVFEILRQSATGEHSVGAFGRHVSRALLTASRPDGWTLMEGMLVAAQRQEGLRQIVLEAIDEAHPEAFRRMLHSILEHDLTRYSACIRAVDTWFSFQWEAMDAKFAAAALRLLIDFLDDADARDSAFQTAPGGALYMALHALATRDAAAAADRARQIASDTSPSAAGDRRYVAARLLRIVALPGAAEALVPLIDDPDPRLSAEALLGLAASDAALLGDSELFERLERLLTTLKQPSQTFEAVVWPWNSITLERSAVADALVRYLGPRPSTRLLPHLPAMSIYGRNAVVRLLAREEPLAAASRDALFGLISDASSYVRETAFQALAKCALGSSEAGRVEALLARKSDDVRRAALTMLLRQGDDAALASADRLIDAPKPEQRAGGVEMLAQLLSTDRARAETIAKIDSYRDRLTRRGDHAALRALDTVAKSQLAEAKPSTLDDALGLMDPAKRSQPVLPRVPRRFLIFSAPKAALDSPAADNIIVSLNKLIDDHAETSVEFETRWRGKQTELFGNIGYSFPDPWPGMPETVRMPLESVWLDWERSRGPELRDPDGYEFYRAASKPRAAMKVSDYNRCAMILFALHWFLYLRRSPADADFLLDALETACAQRRQDTPRSADSQTTSPTPSPQRDWRDDGPVAAWLRQIRRNRLIWRGEWTPEQMRRYWGLLRWIDEPAPGEARKLPAADELIDAYEAGAANANDVFDHLLGPANQNQRGYGSFNLLKAFSGRRMGAEEAKHPWLAPYVQRSRERIVELELQRGELPGPSAQAAQALAYSGDMAVLLRLADALGKSDLSRRGATWYNAGNGRAETLSKLIKATWPAESESDAPDGFAQAARAAGVPDKLLVQTAVFAPQWSEHIERALGWPGMSEGVWWLHAHTKGPEYAPQSDEWKAEVSRRTPLEAQDLLDGAVDVAWFHRVRDALPPVRWKALDEAAKFTSSGVGHKRAQAFADAMLGKSAADELAARAESKRNQDSLRALGLVPLPSDAEQQRAEVLRRYAVIQEFLRGSRKFGSQRQASEKQAAAIALQNLARTAGYPDPVRLEWAMEQAAIADLAGGAVVERSAGEITVHLSIDEFGAPLLEAQKNGKSLKSLPPAAKKDEAVAGLVQRKQEITRQQSRMRASLEAAMCRGDAFAAAELQALMLHPVLQPMLRSLVFVAEPDSDSAAEPAMGYPVDGGNSLERFDAAAVPLAAGCGVRIAHPYDLLHTGQWDKWQWDCFTRERVQPFKQMFRELYLLTAAERDNGQQSMRYAGHQVNFKQGLALLGKRGWVGSAMDGDLTRTFHAEGLTAQIEFDAGYTTPAEVEGLTIQNIVFRARGKYEPAPLAGIPPRVFSEAMRDVDLLVSVAHQGGVDPEASASTIEMREALVRDACRLLKIGNVRFAPSHVIVDGHLGKYTIHLGSGTVHRQPGGFLCIVPVHSQHRGRLFLPFADDDPRTAEIVSKTILLANDKEMKDPIILEQIYAGAAG